MAVVALIGGAGFIGHNLAIALRNDGHEVLVIDNLMRNNVVDNITNDIEETRRVLNDRFFKQRFFLMRDAGVVMENVDARDENGLWNALDRFKPTDIVHLSAISSAVAARAVPGLCFDLQLVTLKNCLEYARRHGVNVTFMSSSTVYGDFEGDEVTENTRPRPKGIYANAKYMGERLLRTYSDQYGIATTIIRPSALYGERCVSRRVSQAFIENALEGKPLLLEGGGGGKLDFTHIDDLVDGIILAMKNAGGTSTYNITFGNARTIRELAEIVNSVVPCLFEERPKADLKPVRGTLSTDRAWRDLGFMPKWPLEVGYKRYCEWYKDQWESLHR